MLSCCYSRSCKTEILQIHKEWVGVWLAGYSNDFMLNLKRKLCSQWRSGVWNHHLGWVWELKLPNNMMGYSGLNITRDRNNSLDTEKKIDPLYLSSNGFRVSYFVSCSDILHFRERLFIHLSIKGANELSRSYTLLSKLIQIEASQGSNGSNISLPSSFAIY